MLMLMKVDVNVKKNMIVNVDMNQIEMLMDDNQGKNVIGNVSRYNCYQVNGC